jgi:simple sugar transport system substrate-binding protein
MKNVFRVFLMVLTLVFSFTGCAKKEAEPVPAPAQEEGLTIVSIPKLVGVAWFDRMISGGERWVEKNGGKFYQSGPSTADAALQLQALEDAITERVDVIQIVPNSTETLEVSMKKAMDAGIIVISHEAPDAQNVHYDIEAFQNSAYGEHFIKALAELTGGSGEYAIIVGSVQAQTHMEWANSALAYQKVNYPNMKLVGDFVESNEDHNTAYTKTQELLKTYPNLKGIIGCSVIDPAGAALAVEEAGKVGQVFVIGTSVVDVVAQYLESGAVSMISLWDTDRTSYAMCEVAKIIKAGGTVKNGDNLGAEGYTSVSVQGHVIYGEAWVDITVANMDADPYR